MSYFLPQAPAGSVVEAADKVGKYASLLMSGAKRPLPPRGPIGHRIAIRRIKIKKYIGHKNYQLINLGVVDLISMA